MKPALLLGIMGLALPGFLGYHMLYARHLERARVIQARRVQEQADAQARSDVATLLAQVDEYRKRLPQEADPSWLVRHVMAVGRTTGLQLTTITQQAPEPSTQYTRLSVNVQFDATYHQLGEFLAALEGSEAFIRVDRLEFQEPPDKGAASTIQMTLSTLYLAQ